MATAKRKTPATKGSRTDAINLLIADHKLVQKQFKQFEKIEDDGPEKAELVKKICSELTVHARIEEEIFYPAVREQIGEEDLMDEAEVEHATAKQTIAELESMKPGDDKYDAKVTVLGEYINHHVEEEQNEMFPKVRKAKVDTETLGVQMAERKQEIMEELGIGEVAEATEKRTSRRPTARRSNAIAR